MLRRLLLVVVSLSCLAPPARAEDVMEPYPAPAPTPAPPPVFSPPPVAAPQPMQPYDEAGYPPPQPQYQPPPPSQPPQYQYYAPAQGYYVQPSYVQQPAPRYHLVEQPRYGLMVAGIVLLGTSWSINALTASLIGDWRLAVPVAGPLIYAPGIDTSNNDLGSRTAVTFLVLDALVETAGAVMIFAGALTHRHVRVQDQAKVTVVPTAGFASLGLAAFGRF